VSWVLADHGGAGFSDGNGGHSFSFPGGAAAAGDLLALGISSDTVVSQPSGWSTAESDVGNIGAYLFYTVAAGGEASVTVTTSGNFATALGFLRYQTPTATPLDAVAAGRNTVSNNTTPAATTGALAETGELSIAAACLGGLQVGNQTNIAWSTGYTNQVDQTSGGTSSSDQHVFIADNPNAGTAAESPSASWTGNTNNQTLLVATFRAAPTNLPDVPGTLQLTSSAPTLRNTSSGPQMVTTTAGGDA